MKHNLVFVLEETAFKGHVFGILKVDLDGIYIFLEKRCVLCQILPIDLMTVDGSIQSCEGLVLRA